MEDIHIINLFLERSEDAIRQVRSKVRKIFALRLHGIFYITQKIQKNA